MPIPARPESYLVLFEAYLFFRCFKDLLNFPASSHHAHHFLKGRPDWSIDQVECHMGRIDDTSADEQPMLLIDDPLMQYPQTYPIEYACSFGALSHAHSLKALHGIHKLDTVFHSYHPHALFAGKNYWLIRVNCQNEELL